MSEKIWSDEAWDDYIYWQLQDKKTLKRINQLIKDIERKFQEYVILNGNKTLSRR